MAERCLLHQNKLDLLKWWLSSRGYEIRPTKGTYEVLRANKGKDTVIIFKKDGAKEHLTVQDKDYGLIKQFIRETRGSLKTAEYIEREALLKEMHGLHSVPNFQGHQTDEDILFQTMVDVVQEQPAADVQEVKHGEWIWTENGAEDYEQFWVCSCCGDKDYIEDNYCPHCGAKMNKERKK